MEPPPPTARPQEDSIDELLTRMRSADREAAATFITRYGARLRRRVRGKLSPAMRQIFDSQDILSTVGRRLDQFVRAGHLAATNENQLWALVFKIAENAIIKKAQVYRRLRQVEGPDTPFARGFLERLQRAETRADGPEVEIDRALQLFPDSIDRHILAMWLANTQFNTIAVFVDMSPSAVRHRWAKIKRRLQERFKAEAD